METTTDLIAEIEIAASPARVWELVHDLIRMPEWSPQVTSVCLRDGFTEFGLGTQFTNRNQLGELEWTTHGEVVRYEPHRQIAFKIQENWVIWSFTLKPLDDGTRLVQRRETPEGISPLSKELTEGFMGGAEVFTASMREGMRETLQAIKAAAES
ncbi:MAG: SRPBCC family protein [Marmoricola sp.]